MKKTHPQATTAVALRYDVRRAPLVTARGKGLLAEEIIKLANQSGIPIQERPELVQLLARVEPGTEIPEALYVAVAEVIAFACMISNKRPGKLHRETVTGTYQRR